VLYQRHDLLSLKPIRTGFSLVVCKNVLLHFTEEERAAVVQMFHRALDEGGFLATEHTQKLPPGTEHLFRPVAPYVKIFRKV